MTVNAELRRGRKETVKAYFKLLSCNMSRGTKVNLTRELAIGKRIKPKTAQKQSSGSINNLIGHSLLTGRKDSFI
jgi:hypothetical protein